jgi:hypothetical protein
MTKLNNNHQAGEIAANSLNRDYFHNSKGDITTNNAAVMI